MNNRRKRSKLAEEIEFQKRLFADAPPVAARPTSHTTNPPQQTYLTETPKVKKFNYFRGVILPFVVSLIVATISLVALSTLMTFIYDDPPRILMYLMCGIVISIFVWMRKVFLRAFNRGEVAQRYPIQHIDGDPFLGHPLMHDGEMITPYRRDQLQDGYLYHAYKVNGNIQVNCPRAFSEKTLRRLMDEQQ